jgi:hypothetical protein
MPAETLKCQQCGGALELQPAGQPANCAYCGTKHTVPANAARELNPEEIAAKLEQAKAHVTGMMDAAMPGHRKLGVAMLVAFGSFFVIVLAFILFVATKVFSHF